MNYDRRTFLVQAGAGIALSSATPGIAVASGSGHAPLDAKGALATLMEGNARFVADKAPCPHLTARRMEIAQGQHPFVTILACADSREGLETIFNQIPGNIFAIRVAGNIVERGGRGSIEYSLEHLNVPLVLVLGHSHCGAVEATLAFLKDGTKQPGDIQYLVDTIVPAVKGTPDIANAVAANVRASVAAVKKQSAIVAEASASGKVVVVGGVYDLESGKVTLLS